GVVSNPGRAAWLAVLCCMGMAAQPLTVAACGIPGVTVKAAPSADYFEIADELLGPNRPAGLNAWLPYGVAITNRSPQNILAVAVRWTISTASGPVTKTITPSSFDQPRQQLAPGKSAIIVPHAFLAGGPLPKVFQSSAGVVRELATFQAARAVEVALDGVVFASGQFEGPDTNKEFEELVAATTAPAHVASTVLTM